MAKRVKQENQGSDTQETPEQKKVSDALKKMAEGEHGRESIRETCSVPLETLVAGINLSNLRYNPEYKRYESRDYNANVSWDRGEGHPIGQKYIDFLLVAVTKPGVEKFMKAVANTILVDLGANSCNSYFLARALGARGYIGVDKFNPGEEDDFNEAYSTELWEKKLKNKNNVPLAVVQEDMLTFLKRLPDNSVSILTTGIQIGIKGNYSSQVEREIARVLDPKGAYLTYASVFEPKELKKEEPQIQGQTDEVSHTFFKFTK